jgi:type IV pilus assembly protein PilO
MQLTLNKLPWYGQIGIFVALAFAGVAAFYYYYAQPLQAEMTTRDARLTQLRGDINRGLMTAKRLPEFERQINELKERLDSLKAVLPEQKDVGDLLRRIQTTAAQSNLSITGFKPEPTSTKQMHTEIPITLELDGTYHNLGIFFDRVSKFSRIINVSGVKIRAKDRPTDASSSVAECRATTFVLLEPKGAAAAAPGAAVRK